MGLTTPHHAREWFIAAALRVCHEYRVTSLYKPKTRAIELLKATLEIDVHAKLACFFGTTSNIFAQGRGDIDVQVWAPTLNAEVKFLINKRNAYKDVVWDWDELVKFANVNDKFAQRAWVVFLPKTDWFDFADCQSVKKPTGVHYNWEKIAPFLPFTEPHKLPTWAKEKLKWRGDPARLTVIWMPGGKKVRVDLVGTPSDTLWAAVYSRMTPDEYAELKTFTEIKIADKSITPVNRSFV